MISKTRSKGIPKGFREGDLGVFNSNSTKGFSTSAGALSFVWWFGPIWLFGKNWWLLFEVGRFLPANPPLQRDTLTAAFRHSQVPWSKKNARFSWAAGEGCWKKQVDQKDGIVIVIIFCFLWDMVQQNTWSYNTYCWLLSRYVEQ